jgi:hypothetical protein
MFSRVADYTVSRKHSRGCKEQPGKEEQIHDTPSIRSTRFLDEALTHLQDAKHFEGQMAETLPEEQVTHLHLFTQEHNSIGFLEVERKAYETGRRASTREELPYGIYSTFRFFTAHPERL